MTRREVNRCRSREGGSDSGQGEFCRTSTSGRKDRRLPLGFQLTNRTISDIKYCFEVTRYNYGYNGYNGRHEYSGKVLGGGDLVRNGSSSWGYGTPIFPSVVDAISQTTPNVLQDTTPVRLRAFACSALSLEWVRIDMIGVCT